MNDNKDMIETMAKAGMHFGALRSKRHPSTKGFVFGTKGKVEITDLEKSAVSLLAIAEYVKTLSRAGKQILFVGTKNEAKEETKRAAESIHQPYVINRWIGGTLTNHDEIRKRIDRLALLSEEERTGEFSKYTKKERLLLGKEMKDLERLFSGIVELTAMPGAMLVIDSNKEEIAVAEAKRMNIPVIAFSNTDCDLGVADHAIVGNDKSISSIGLVLSCVVSAYKEGRSASPDKADKKA